MILTESDARQHWCPFSKVAVGPAGDVYTSMPGNHSNCCGSGCMAWRACDVNGKTMNVPSLYGYCGLAGAR